MAKQLSRQEIHIASAAVAQAGESERSKFIELLRLGGIDPTTDLPYENWSGVDFSGCNLSGFDFTGARLYGCNFSGVKLLGGFSSEFSDKFETRMARFEQAVIDRAEPYAKLDPNRTNFRAATDWEQFARTWTRASSLPSDGHLTVGDVFQDAPFSPEMVVVPAGEFWMGSSDGFGGDRREIEEPDRRDDEEPRQHVVIERPFAVGRFVVTFDEWNRFLIAGATSHEPSDQGWGKGGRPVINVSWEDANAYVAWLTEKTGKVYRLLFEAEWEYCCRAGTETAYAFGDESTSKHLLFGAKQTSEVGTYLANAWGLYDMHGNVWEWCEDLWHESYGEAHNDGSTWSEEGNSSRRVNRGGSWNDYRWNLRSASRGGDYPIIRSDIIGFRVGRTL